jgi:uncharacterized protein YihD (DUF1040 family)
VKRELRLSIGQWVIANDLECLKLAQILRSESRNNAQLASLIVHIAINHLKSLQNLNKV